MRRCHIDDVVVAWHKGAFKLLQLSSLRGGQVDLIKSHRLHLGSKAIGSTVESRSQYHDLPNIVLDGLQQILIDKPGSHQQVAIATRRDFLDEPTQQAVW